MLSFKEYVDRETCRLACGETDLERQLAMLFDGYPRLETALMLRALCNGRKTAEDLVRRVQALNVSASAVQHRMAVEKNWTALLETLSVLSAEDLATVLENADGDEMEAVGFPVPYAKYADTWYVFRDEDNLAKRFNDAYRRSYNQKLQKNELTIDQCRALFDDKFDVFLSGQFDYPLKELLMFPPY